MRLVPVGVVVLGACGGTNGGVCVPHGVSFDLMVDSTDSVWYGGSTPPWPAASLGCPGWLTITAQGESMWGAPEAASVNVQSNGCEVSCPAFQPQAAARQSFTWDGTYYPETNGSCTTPACAPPGSYGVTFCVGYDGPDAGSTCGPGAPTCQSFSFTWPPATPSESTVAVTITPTLGGG